MGSHWRDSSRVYDERADEYDSWFEDSLLFDIEKEAVASLSLSTETPALEIGVGPGRFAMALGSSVGIDPAFAPLLRAKKRNINVCQSVGEALPFLSNTFATVSLYFTLCFLENPAAVLHEARRVLHTDGHLVLGLVPASGKWGRNLQQKKINNHPFYKYAHFFTIADVEMLLKESRFLITSSVSSLYQEPGNITRMEYSIPGRDENAGFVSILAEKER